MDATKLKTYLECPVCFIVPRSKIFVCKNSHKICEACYTKLKTQVNSKIKLCPQGECMYDNPPSRNLDLESIVDNSDVKHCCERSQCEVEMTKANILEHEAKCDFREVPCPATICEKKTVLRLLASHLKSEHNYRISGREIEFLVRFNTLTKGNSVDWPLQLWEYNRVQFFPQLVKRNGVWYAWVKVKGGPNDAEQWSYSAKTENKDNGIKMEFSGSVHPVDLRVEQVIQTGDCLQMNSKNIQKLKNNNGALLIKFKVF
eukprot:GFUD01037655.1.p1 GENE.GFUD01037655.1~~GFUD01037655.1.p1  ORF type:complete len:259 (+),score=52.87 GFUD01037655.1:70-846(+)